MAGVARVWGGVIIIGLGAAVAWLGLHQSPSAPAAAPPPARAVHALAAAQQDMPVYVRGIGTVEPFNAVQIKTRVDGQILAIHFTEGQDVHVGDLLFEVDPRPYQAALAQAEAQLVKDRAGLTSAAADLDRTRTLLQRGYRAQKDLDGAQATAAQLEATLKADQAAIDAARLQVSYAAIRAPIDGRIGKRLVDAGNVIYASDSKPLVEIDQIDPIAISFTVPQSALPEIQARSAAAALPVEVRPPDDARVLTTGRLSLIGNSIDRTTGTIALKAVFDNPDRRLWPGQFVNARLVLQTLSAATVVPIAAIQAGPAGTVAYVVGPDGAIDVRPITIAARAHDLAAIASGVKPGDLVVTEGQDGLAVGARVMVVPPEAAS